MPRDGVRPIHDRFLGITEIRLERTACDGTCPIDEIILRSDGTATYIGERFVKREGRYHGTFKRSEFLKLAMLTESQGFFDMKDRYDRPITDQPSRITSVTGSDRTKRVENYGEAGPAGLREIEEAILAVMGRFEWQEE